MIRTLLIGALASLWGTVVFVVGLHVNFPSSSLLDRARWEVQDRSEGAYALDATQARLWRLTGIEVDDAVLYRVPPARSRGADEGPVAVPMVRVDSLAARVQLLPLVSGKQTLGFLAEVFGGDLDGSITLDGTRTVVDARGSDLDLARMPIEGDEWSVDATGIARLVVDLSTDAEDIKASSGTLTLDIDDFVVRSATAMGMTFDQQFDFTEAGLAFEVDDGKATVTRGAFVSEALTAAIEGDITLNKRGLSRWRLKLDIKLDLGEDLEQMAKFAGISDARDDDGSYHFSCTGSLGSPRCRADGVASGQRSTTRRGRNARVRSRDRDDGPPALEGSGDEDEDRRLAREKRRERRLERLRERRERLREVRDDGADPPTELTPPDLTGGPLGPRGRAFDRDDVIEDVDDFEDRDFQDRDADFEEPDFQEFEDDFEPVEDDFPAEEEEFFED